MPVPAGAGLSVPDPTRPETRPALRSGNIPLTNPDYPRPGELRGIQRGPRLDRRGTDTRPPVRLRPRPRAALPIRGARRPRLRRARNDLVGRGVRLRGTGRPLPRGRGGVPDGLRGRSSANAPRSGSARHPERDRLAPDRGIAGGDGRRGRPRRLLARCHREIPPGRRSVPGDPAPARPAPASRADTPHGASPAGTGRRRGGRRDDGRGRGLGLGRHRAALGRTAIFA